MLVAESLKKTYKSDRSVDAVCGVDLSVKEGEFVAIVGRSGSGKSSLLAMIGGLSRPTSGKVHVDGSIGFVFQFPSLLPSLRVLDNVALPALISRKIPEREAYQRARTLLEEVGLGTKYDFYPNELSGGEQRRVAIARALVNSPKLLLADEPTADLDEETEREILELLIGIQRAYGLTLVVVTHNTDIANRADRVLRMKAGSIVSDEANLPVSSAPLTVPKEIFAANRTSAFTDRSTLAVGFERFVGRLVMFLLPAMLALWCINFGVTQVEAHFLEKQDEARQALEDLAMSGLRAEVKDVTLGPTGKYNLTLYLRNTGTAPIYVLTPAVRGFVQIGNSWQEYPLEPVTAPAQKLLKITDETLLHYSFDTSTVEGFIKLIPHYMHVRFSNEMLVSASDQPKSDLIERSDNYYVYLKPHDADDKAILRDLKFPEAPPIWIPMPPH
jgi:ABC-type lipoprotein export system ATPase subunit